MSALLPGQTSCCQPLIFPLVNGVTLSAHPAGAVSGTFSPVGILLAVRMAILAVRKFRLPVVTEVLAWFQRLIPPALPAHPARLSFGVSVCLCVFIVVWMPLRAVGFLGVDGAKTEPTGDIFDGRYNPEMIRVAASPVSAQMVNAQPVWYSSPQKLPSISVYGRGFPVDGHLPVAVPSAITHPFPAPFLRDGDPGIEFGFDVIRSVFLTHVASLTATTERINRI